MFNVLPDILKEEIKKEYTLRLLLVIFLCIIFIQVSFLIFIFPSWIVSSYREKDIVSQIAESNTSPISNNANAVSSVVSSTNLKLNIINTFLKYPEVTPIFNAIVINKTPGITLNQFLYTSVQTDEASISLGGVAVSREALVLFSKTLEQTKIFKTVDLPVSNLAKDKNIEFTINLTLAP